MVKNKGYKILYAGSTFAGENPVKENQNTLEKIFKLAEKKKFRDSTSIHKVPGKNVWAFVGNYEKVSAVFNVKITDERVAKRVQTKLRNKKKYF
jgi:hypothetical protein